MTSDAPNRPCSAQWPHRMHMSRQWTGGANGGVYHQPLRTRGSLHRPVNGESLVQLNLVPRDNTTLITLSALCLKRLRLYTPTISLDPSVWQLWESIDLADPTFDQPSEVELFLGADVYHRLLKPESMQHGEIFGQRTVVGWVLTGRAPGRSSSSVLSCSTLQDKSAPAWHQELVSLLQRFWELEDLPQARHQVPADIECERTFSDHWRDEDGRYIVRLPSKQDALHFLGNNLESARASLRSLQAHLHQNPDMAIESSRFMDEYVALGHMRPLSDALVSAPTRPVYYIPHHGIWQRGDRESKLRVVFSASHATSSGYSLNDVLHTGPRLQAALPTVLLRWR
ncbi:uncharacterized protein LOC106645855 [Copidosoma floridanum]|uniref:uncharacterized protein LOC106645855 n=1 Tax=Copidosoma floridanum TaxID=29053 RepID=UPI0006C9CB3E|nr:uncharacterized protein LOC106645855 [Copidosoma floridanum]